MFGWIKKIYSNVRKGVIFPETFYILPVLVKLPNTGYEIILKEDGSIEGSFEEFDKFCRNQIVTEYAEGRIIVWLLREHWKRLRQEEDDAQTAITKPSPVSMLVEEETANVTFDGEKTSKTMKVTMQTVDGPKEFEYNVEENDARSDNK
jgi:hypothetical protein